MQLERERGNVQSLPPPEPQKSAPLWLPQPRSGSNLPRQGSAGSATSSSSGGTCGGLVHGWGPLPAHGPSGSGRHAARDRRHMESLLSEWQIPPETIEFMKVGWVVCRGARSSGQGLWCVLPACLAACCRQKCRMRQRPLALLLLAPGLVLGLSLVLTHSLTQLNQSIAFQVHRASRTHCAF